MKNLLKNPKLQRTTKLLQNDRDKDSLLIGILGGGRLGSQIANCLLSYGRINPKELQISTRRPETLEHLKQRGVDCYHDNLRLVRSVHVVLVCVLPSQLSGVADEVKDHLPSNILLYLPTCGIPTQRLRQMLGTCNILQPLFSWDATSSNKHWDCDRTVYTALESKDTVLKTCPLSDNAADNVITVNPKLAELFVFAAINMCADLALTREESLRAVNVCMFGDSDKQPLRESLTLADFGGGKDGGSTLFPQFDLVHINESHSRITEKLSSSTELRQAFIKHYWQTFEEYLQMKMCNHLL